jgi:DNA-binding response OmpR family regulator
VLWGQGKAGVSVAVGVLVVEDFEPFRRFVTSTLRTRPELKVICEVADGSDAVQKAEELQPDLVVLDIGLATLNGIEAARRIRKVAPASKILFLSQESCTEVVQEAFKLGALGYVVKGQAASELLVAVDAVLQGRQFVGSGLDSGRHEVQFYPDDASLVDGLVNFAEPALRAGQAAIVVASGTRRTRIFQRLQERGLDMDAAIEQGCYVSLEVADMLSTFMVNDMPDPVRFFNAVGGLIASSAQAAVNQQQPRVVACGECASSLWAQGKTDAAIKFEQLCNQLSKGYDVTILCGFQLKDFCREEDKQVFEKICRGLQPA